MCFGRCGVEHDYSTYDLGDISGVDGEVWRQCVLDGVWRGCDIFWWFFVWGDWFPCQRRGLRVLVNGNRVNGISF